MSGYRWRNDLSTCESQTMISVVAGFATAFFFAIGMIAAARASRTVHATQVVALSALISSLFVVPWALSDGVPALTTGQAGLMLLSGIGNIFGFLCVYTALKYGKVGLVAPIVATEGGIAALIASILGRSVDPIIAFVLLIIVLGIVIGARSHDPEPFPGEKPVRAALFAVAGSLLFAMGLVAVGLLSGDVPLSWVLLPARLVGVVILTLPLLVLGRLRVPRRILAWVVLLATVDVIAISIYTIGAASNLPVTAVLASQMAPLAAVLAFVLFKERLGRGQIVGLVVMMAGMTVLGVLQ